MIVSAQNRNEPSKRRECGALLCPMHAGAAPKPSEREACRFIERLSYRLGLGSRSEHGEHVCLSSNDPNGWRRRGCVDLARRESVWRSCLRPRGL